ncbi:MAG: di-heme-cytochrome C peroxidase [Granulosicoccus sp.]
MKKTDKIVAIAFSCLALSGCASITQGINPPPDRSALIDTNDTALSDNGGAPVTKIVYPDQNWSSAQSLWFYNTTQGSNLIPYRIFINLEQPGADNQALFRSKENMRSYRYLNQKPSFGNPDGLPVGWVKDTYRKKDYVGLTCAACHTGQLNYQGTGIRIDGGTTLADMEMMLADMEEALHDSLNGQGDSAKFQRLATSVLGKDVSSKNRMEDFEEELNQSYASVRSYNRSNAPVYNSGDKKEVRYGYARLDAFGRIYNRILEHISIDEVPDNNPPTAPVSYPFLWDTPYHDFVQWNGIANNGSTLGLGPLGRNIGEVLGVFASIDIHYKNADKNKLNYYTSADTLNIARLERHLKKLESPRWKDLSTADTANLPPINEEFRSKGEVLFRDYGCAACHANIPDRGDTSRRIIAQMTSHEKLGTDRTMAENAMGYCGSSGKFVNKDLGACYGVESDGRHDVPVAAALSSAVKGVISSTSKKGLDFGWTRDVLRKLYVGTLSIFGNPIRNTERHVDLVVSNKQFIAGYKGRPLNGIWATAPYLHNGSVPTLADLLLPKCSEAGISSGEKKQNQCRPNTFLVGNPEFDPVKVGYRQAESGVYPGIFVFDTSIPGNGNQGHEYAAGNTPSPEIDKEGNVVYDENGKPVFNNRPPMNEKERMYVVEYMKSL